MIGYGAAPASDEIEVTLFGPGYGEAVAIHLGENGWMLVDSCIDPDSKAPASATYLDQIGVGADEVRAIVASHWHDDHVRGISQLASKYPAAQFTLSAIFNTREAGAFLSAYSGESSAGLARGAKELFLVTRDRETVFPALHKSIVFDATLNGQRVLVTAQSPVPAAFAQSLAHMAQYMPRKGDAIGHAPEVHPNMEAITLHIDTGSDAVLLGADLEEHALCGWSAVVSDAWSAARRPASVYKVAHHGSQSADCPQVWATMLQPDVVACLTPFTLGDLRLPTDSDRVRLRTNARRAYISSGASRRPSMDSRILKRLSHICKKITRVDASFGAVRLRKRIGAPSWDVELFGAAQEL